MPSIKHISATSAALLSLLAGCSDEAVRNPGGDGEDGMQPMRISAAYPLATRAGDNGFADGDRMGVFVVDRTDSGKDPELKLSGNRADNVRLTKSESENRWNSETEIFWKDKNTPVDIYAYYPYDFNLNSVEEYTFSVQRHQETGGDENSLAGYEASDLLLAHKRNVAYTTSQIDMQLSHLMAGVKLTIKPGQGFDIQKWNEATKSVVIENTVRMASVNLSTGEVKPSSDQTDIIVPIKYADGYRAVVVPQTVKAGQPLIGIDIDGKSYHLTKTEAMTFSQGKMHNFTIEVEMKSDGGAFEFKLADESITPWLEDSEFHDGIVRQYITVRLERHGTLKSVMKERKIAYESLQNLKIIGEYDDEDIRFMREEMTVLSNLNLKEAIPVDFDGNKTYTFGGFEGKSSISHVVFPDNIKKIGYHALQGSGLTGDIIIPEGIEEILWGAFLDTNVRGGRLYLPSSLKVIDGSAFEYTGLTGQLQLPENLVSLGGGAFNGCNFTGEFRLPSNVRLGKGHIVEGNFSGDLLIPPSVTENDYGFNFAGCGFEGGQLSLPEGMTFIPNQLVTGCGFTGELVIPSTVRHIGSYAFENTNFTSVVLPENLIYIDFGAFAGSRLSGTVTLPGQITRIYNNTFENCNMLEGINIPAKVTSIGERSFAGCNNLLSIVVEAEEPPVIQSFAFDGVPLGDCVVEVPKGCLQKYRSADGWREFQRLTEHSDLVCSPSSACALNSSRDQDLTLYAKGNWTVKSQPDWVKLSKASGNGKTSITLSFSALSHGAGTREGEIVFASEDGFTSTCSLIQSDYEHDEDVCLTLQKASKGNGIDILFIGDGWTAPEIASGAWLDLVKQQTEYFFGIHPYSDCREYFNVYAAISLSQQSGVNTLHTYRDTRFETIYSGSSSIAGCSYNSLMVDGDIVFEYAKAVSPVKDINRTLIIFVPNTTEYPGTTQNYWFGGTISICPPVDKPYPSDIRGTIQHEAGGHGFGKLADESISINMFAPSSVKQTIRENQEGGIFRNVSVSGKMSDVPWQHLIFDKRYSLYVAVFEGAMGYTRGVYRSESNSCMNYGIPYYNAISRQAIYQRILDYAGEEFTMEKFFAIDSREWGPTGQSETRSTSDLIPYNEGRHYMKPMLRRRALSKKGKQILYKSKLNK